MRRPFHTHKLQSQANSIELKLFINSCDCGCVVGNHHWYWSKLLNWMEFTCSHTLLCVECKIQLARWLTIWLATYIHWQIVHKVSELISIDYKLILIQCIPKFIYFKVSDHWFVDIRVTNVATTTGKPPLHTFQCQLFLYMWGKG